MRLQNKSSLAYMFRNFAHLFYVALPAAVLTAFFVNPTREINLWQNLFSGSITSFESLFPQLIGALTVVRFGKFWWVSAIAMVFLAFTVSMLVVKINRHMHVGEMSALPFRRAFKLFPITLLLVVCYFAAGEIIMLLSIGVTYILRAVGNVTAAAVVGMALSVALRLLCAWLFMLLLIALPLKYGENYHLNVALAYSVRVMSKENKVVWGASFAYLLGRYALMALAYLLIPYNLHVLVYAVTYLFVIMAIPCLAFGVYYDAIGGERRDISQVIFR